VPTDGEARTVLLDRYARALATKDAAAFCHGSRFAELCQRTYRVAGGRAAVPTSPPVVQRSEVGGMARVLTVCGVNGRGRPYRTQFSVSSVDGGLAWLPDVFWEEATAVAGTEPC
jgi:hypothetical protein